MSTPHRAHTTQATQTPTRTSPTKELSQAENRYQFTSKQISMIVSFGYSMVHVRMKICYHDGVIPL